MRILGIETSCDETAAAVVEDGQKVLSNVTASMVKLFESSGGVIPEEAARKQVEWVLPVIKKALEEAKVSWDDIDAIAVTKGPGLLVSLLVGTTTARFLADLHNKLLIGVHHTLGHLSSTWLEAEEDIQLPVLTLSASGGHTDLWLRTSHAKGRLLGRTRDDAAGEAFDKGALQLGLPYPGGPSISKSAESGDAFAYEFPRPLHDDPSLDFSLSGLKTSLKNLLKDLQATTYNLPDVAASYQHGICAHLVDRIERAYKKHPEVKEIHLVGGVSANTHLRQLVAKHIPEATLRFPKHIRYCTDNAAMIAAAGYFLQQEEQNPYDAFTTTASLPLEEVVRS